VIVETVEAQGALTLRRGACAPRTRDHRLGSRARSARAASDSVAPVVITSSAIHTRVGIVAARAERAAHVAAPRRGVEAGLARRVAHALERGARDRTPARVRPRAQRRARD
jgi:hypothetical protein